MDIVSKEKRSEMMSGIKSRDTKPEILVRKMLFTLGFRYRLNQKISGFRPDIVLRKYNTCIFIHGCFWHRHEGCKLASNPKSNLEFWEKKFTANRNRDEKAIATLKGDGWRVGIIWECAVRSGEYLEFDYLNAFEQKEFWSLESIR